MKTARKPAQTVKIGPHTYKVLYTNRLQHSADYRSLCGQIDFRKGTIEIDEQIASPTYRKLTLWHEILHGILEAGGIQDHDEQQIDVIAAGIIQVLQDNPWMRK